MTDTRKFKAPANPKERIWQETNRLRTAHREGRSLPRTRQILHRPFHPFSCSNKASHRSPQCIGDRYFSTRYRDCKSAGRPRFPLAAANPHATKVRVAFFCSAIFNIFAGCIVLNGQYGLL